MSGGNRDIGGGSTDSYRFYMEQKPFVLGVCDYVLGRFHESYERFPENAQVVYETGRQFGALYGVFAITSEGGIAADAVAALEADQKGEDRAVLISYRSAMRELEQKMLRRLAQEVGIPLSAIEDLLDEPPEGRRRP